MHPDLDPVTALMLPQVMPPANFATLMLNPLLTFCQAVLHSPPRDALISAAPACVRAHIEQSSSHNLRKHSAPWYLASIGFLILVRS